MGIRERRHARLLAAGQGSPELVEGPTDNAFVESFNGRLREKCLKSHWFLSLADARAKIEAWRRL
jgi:transposase InsO family protein